MMDNGQRDINMSAHMSVLLAQHDTSGGDQFSGFPPAGTGLSNLDGVDQASNNRNANPFVQHHTSGGGQFPGVPHNMQYPAGRGFLDPSSAHFGSNDQSFNFAAMQNTIGIAQYLQAMHSMQGPPYHNSWGHTNMVQGYPGPQTGHFGAQSNVHHSMGHYAAQPSHDTITGPNGQNNFQPCMGYDAAQFNHSTGTGRGDA
ncbi:hypothetical protein UCDDA912_g05671 [Diaporthe ampelina]|uniref:Uncharacterized protein n=1 Tax=Diaporthe ampelina TaxID=1214573 RepID=A0A0G2FJ78_9PEZI|nr:hypothetical protein UCDDA912_g05671 [Diaporthe ampelina]